VIILGFLLVIAATILYLQQTIPIYQAVTTLIREQENGAATFLFESKGLSSLTDPSIERQQILLSSRLIVNEITKQMAANGFPITTGEVREHISLNAITSKGSILNVTANSDNPTEAMVLANTTANVYISKMSDLQSTKLDQAESFLSEQMNVVDSKLRQAEEALYTFREREGIVIGDSGGNGSSGLLKQLGDLYAKLSQTRNNRELAEMQLNVAQQLLEEKRREVTSIANNKLTSQIDSLQSLISEWKIQLVLLQQTLTDKSREVTDLQEKIATAQSQLDSYFQELKQHGASIDPLSEWQSLVQESIQLEIQSNRLQQSENMLKAQIAKFKADHPQLIGKEVELIRLERSARIHEQTYMLLMDRYEDTRLLKQMKTVGITVIDRATAPKSPIKPNKRLTITLGMLIGLIVGVGAALFLEYIDDSLRIEKDIEKFLDIPVVGVIPKIDVEKATLKAIEKRMRAGNLRRNEEQTVNKLFVIASTSSPQKGKKRSKRHRKAISNLMGKMITNLDRKSPVTESYRVLRTNIQFANVDEEVKTILVSSPVPSEGKTLTVANLAIMMARMGTKTLIIDADLRRPRLHNIFQQEREPGLSEFLLSENLSTDLESGLGSKSRKPKAENIDTSEESSSAATLALSDVVRTTETENLYLLPSGKRPPNPAELLSSDRMQQLIKELKSEFEIILFDSPPIVPVTDATVLASKITDIMLLVIRSGETKREIAQKAQELLKRVDANIFGVVLNTIDFAKRYGSYYYYYYHSYYSPDENE